MVAFRIVSLPQPHPNRFYAGIQRLPSGSSPTSHRKLSASLRRASHKDAARHAARPCPSGTAPGRKALEKDLKRTPKCGKNAPRYRIILISYLKKSLSIRSRYREIIGLRLSEIVAEKPGGQLRPELRGAAAGRLDNGLQLRQGRGLIVVDHQVVIPDCFLQFSPAVDKAPGVVWQEFSRIGRRGCRCAQR